MQATGYITVKRAIYMVPENVEVEGDSQVSPFWKHPALVASKVNTAPQNCLLESPFGVSSSQHVVVSAKGGCLLRSLNVCSNSDCFRRRDGPLEIIELVCPLLLESLESAVVKIGADIMRAASIAVEWSLHA